MSISLQLCAFLNITLFAQGAIVHVFCTLSTMKGMIKFMSIISIPRNMSKACKLYLERNFEEADRIMEKISEPYHQKQAIEAQLTLFKWDLDNTITKCMEFLPYLNEWRSFNMLDASFAMITFSAAHMRKEEVTEYLESLKLRFETEEDERYKGHMLGKINKSINYLTDNLEKANVSPQLEDLLSVDEAVEKWRSRYQEGQFTADSPENADRILSAYYQKIKPNEYIELYERFHDSSTLREHTRINVIKTYLRMNKIEMIPDAVYDLCKYAWLPVEKTTIMPISILTYDTDLWKLYTKELFEQIYTTASVYFGGVV